MAMQRMDVGQIRRTGVLLKQEAAEINQLISAIDGQVADALQVWHGTDANQFRDWWHNSERPALVRMKQLVEGLGQSAINSAAAQAKASQH